MISIVYKEYVGCLNPVTNEVFFYRFKYANMTEAIECLESDIKKYNDEIEHFESLIKELSI